MKDLKKESQEITPTTAVTPTQEIIPTPVVKKKRIFGRLSVQMINAGLIFLIVAVFLVISAYSYLAISRLNNNSYWVEHSYVVVAQADTLISDLLNTETGQRGYIITGDDSYLAPYTLALQNVYSDFQSLQNLTSDNPAQEEKLLVIKPLIDARLAEVDNGINLRKYKGVDAATAFIMTGGGKKTMDAIRAEEVDFKTEELKLLAQRETDSDQSSSLVNLVILWGAIIGFLFYLLVNYIISRFVIKDLVSKPFLAKEKQALFYARSLIESSLDPLITISPSGKVTDLNEAAVRVTGISREKLIGSDFVNYFTNPDEARDGYERVFRQGSVNDYPLTIRSQEGRLTDVLLNASIYKNEEGVVLGVFAAMRDYTRIKQATEAVELMNREMEAFSSSVSHDLRAPLRVIDGYAQMLSEDYNTKLDDNGKRLIANIRTSSEQMRVLIEDLLTFSRLGSQAIKKEQVSMSTMAKDVFMELKKVAPTRDIECNIADLPDAKADKDTMRLVWVNLISNAIKYTRPKAKAVIEIGSKVEGDVITYYVKDNGVGFDMKYVIKLFLVFERLHSSEEFEGTGIGLANVKRIIERHGGKVWAEGQVGVGSTFYFTLPKA